MKDKKINIRISADLRKKLGSIDNVSSIVRKLLEDYLKERSRCPVCLGNGYIKKRRKL